MIEKIRDKIKDLTLKIAEKAGFKEKLENLYEKLGEKFNKIYKPIKRKKLINLSAKNQRRLEKMLSYRMWVPIFGGVISILGIIFLGYTSYDYLHAKAIKSKSKDSIVLANLNFATVSMIKILKSRRVQQKDLRRIIKELNGIDEFGRMHKFSPCDESVMAIGETPKPGNIVINRVYYNIELTAYDCEIEPIAKNTIKLKKPPRKKKKKKKNEDQSAATPTPKTKTPTPTQKTTDHKVKQPTDKTKKTEAPHKDIKQGNSHH
jgi:hypothetical protein